MLSQSVFTPRDFHRMTADADVSDLVAILFGAGIYVTGTLRLHASLNVQGLSNVRGLLGRSRRPPIRGHTSSVPRHGLRGVGRLKQLPKPMCQQFDGLPQGAELPNPDYRDGSVQVKRRGTQYFHGIDRVIPGNKASG